MDIVIITTVAQSVHHNGVRANDLLANMREDAHATRQLHCQWRSGPFLAKRAANGVSHFMINCLNALSINRRNYKTINSKFAHGFIFQ